MDEEGGRKKRGGKGKEARLARPPLLNLSFLMRGARRDLPLLSLIFFISAELERRGDKGGRKKEDIDSAIAI